MPSAPLQLLLGDNMLLIKLALDFANRKSNCEVGMGGGVSVHGGDQSAPLPLGGSWHTAGSCAPSLHPLPAWSEALRTRLPEKVWQKKGRARYHRLCCFYLLLEVD